VFSGESFSAFLIFIHFTDIGEQTGRFWQVCHWKRGLDLPAKIHFFAAL
jgi:hypothetical protein